MIQLITPIADNNTIFGNTCSNDSRAVCLSDREKVIQKDTGYYIFLGPSFRILIEDERIFESIKMALHHLHLYPFVSGLERVPQQFLDLIRNPLQFNKDDLNTYHPLVLYLTGILNVSMTTMTTELAAISPIGVILKRLSELSILGDNSFNMHKQNILLKYSVFQGLDTKLLLSTLYDLVKGNEGFFLLTLIMLTIDSIFPKQLDSSLPTMERNNNLAQVENALDILKNLEKIEKQKEIDLLFAKLDDLGLDHCNSKSLGKDSASMDLVTQNTPFIFDMHHSSSPKHTSSDFLRDSLYLQQQPNRNGMSTLDINKEVKSLASSTLWNPIQSSITNSYPWNMKSTDKSIFSESKTFWSMDAMKKDSLITEEDKPDSISLSCKDSIAYEIIDKEPYSDLVSEAATIENNLLEDPSCENQESLNIYKKTFEDNVADAISVSSSPRYSRHKYHNKNAKDSPLDSSEGNKSQSNSNEGYQKRGTKKGTNSKTVKEYSTSNSTSLNKQFKSNSSRDSDDDNNGDDKKDFNKSKDNDNSDSDPDSDSDSDSNSESEAETESLFDSESNFASGLNKSEGHKVEQDVVEMLTDLFPIYPRSELVARVKSTNDVENLIDVLFSEQDDQNKPSLKETDAKNYSNDVLTLKEIFPEYDFEVLRKVLNRNDEDIALASAVILQGNPEEISLEGKKSKLRMNMNNHNNGARLQSSWVALQTEATRLEDILNIPSQQLLSYLHKHEGKFHETLVAIINDNSVRRLNVSSASSSSSRSSLASFSQHVPRGGRVQGPSSKPTISVPSIRCESAPPEDKYRYDENSLEAKEIKAIYVGNPEFKSIDEQFLEKSLVFFRGDVAKVIEIAALLVQDKAGHLTFRQKPAAMTFSSISQAVTGKKKKPLSLVEPYKHSNLRSASPIAQFPLSGATSSSSIIAASSRSPTPTDEVSIMKEKLKSAAKTNTLDLHNLTVPTALEATGQALRDWWKDELDQRLVDGNLTRFGSRVQFVNPLNLVTGRGIHSQGGKAKIRIAVKNYLTRNNYVFEEYSGRFEIEGKR